MTGTTTGQQNLHRQPPLLLLLVLGLIALACGIALGVAWHNDNQDHWQTGQGYVGDQEVSVKYQGWTYGADAAVPWIDADGSWHDSGWPVCLRPFKTQPVSFQTRSVTIDGNTWRPIVAIDCRQ